MIRIGFGMLVFLFVLFSVFLLGHLYVNNGFKDYSFFSIEWLCIPYGLIFIKFITADDKVVRIYRPFWFLMRRNSVKMEDIGKVSICIVTAPGGSVTFSFFDKETNLLLSCFTGMYKFEIRKFIRHMNKHNITVDLTGSGSYGFDVN